MKYQFFLILPLALSIAGCGRGGEHSHDMHEDEHSDGIEVADHEHGDGVIVIHDHQAEELGIKVNEAEMMDFSAPLKVSGEVIYNPSTQGVISAPMSGRVSFAKGISEGAKVSRGARLGAISTAGMAGGDQLKGARIEFEAAKKELERIETLRNDGIATVGEYNQAVANLERARNNLSGGAGSVITAPVSGVISSLAIGEGGYANAGDVIGVVSGDGAMTLRVDVPAREISAIQNVATAKVKFPQLDGIVEAKAISGKNNASSTPGYISLYFQLPDMDNIVAGSYGEVYLPTSGAGRTIAVPLSALTDRMGQKMVYVKEPGSEHYRRVPVKAGQSDGENVAVEGLHEGDLVVTEGVTFVRLAENAGVTPPGHTHNH